jgi:hypothetical protein
MLGKSRRTIVSTCRFFLENATRRLSGMLMPKGHGPDSFDCREKEKPQAKHSVLLCLWPGTHHEVKLSCVGRKVMQQSQHEKTPMSCHRIHFKCWSW